MDLTQLAEALGLAKDSPQETILSSAAKAVMDGIAARQSLNTLTSELPKMGIRLEGEKLSRVVEAEAVALDITIKPEDSDEVKTLKKDLANARLSTTQAALASNKAMLDRLTKEGRVPPAGIAALSRLMGMRDQAEVLSLSADGTQVLSRVENVKADLITFLNVLPKLTIAGDKSKLVQLSVEPKDPAAKDPQALAAKGGEMASRISKATKTALE
jgi:hypothetical protein